MRFVIFLPYRLLSACHFGRLSIDFPLTPNVLPTASRDFSPAFCGGNFSTTEFGFLFCRSFASLSYISRARAPAVDNCDEKKTGHMSESWPVPPATPRAFPYVHFIGSPSSRTAEPNAQQTTVDGHTIGIRAIDTRHARYRFSWFQLGRSQGTAYRERWRNI